MFVGLWSRGVVAHTVTSRPSGTAKRSVGTMVGGAGFDGFASSASTLREIGSTQTPATRTHAMVRDKGEMGFMEMGYDFGTPARPKGAQGSRDFPRPAPRVQRG